MYINDLGIGRAVSTDDLNSGLRTSNLTRRKNTDNYSTVMKRAVENQKTSIYPAFSSVGDLIIQEAFKKMEADPEWEETVMDKVKEYYAGDSVTDSAQRNYLNQTGQSDLQNYLLQSLFGIQSGLGLGVSGYSAYGLGNTAASAYGTVMNSGLSSSLFGDWML